MRFSLYGQGEGVYITCVDTFWAYTADNTIVDASLSARGKGVKPGLSVKSAQALLPAIRVYEAGDSPENTVTVTSGLNAPPKTNRTVQAPHMPDAMKRVHDAICLHTPWLETVGSDAFFALIPGAQPPLREVRELLLQIDATLQTEQRVRVALAETPDLARALVAWSLHERVPNATYRKAGRQHFIISPAFAHDREPKVPWFLQLPIQVLWKIPEKARNRLQQLGIHRLSALFDISDTQLIRQFGKESILWRDALVTDADGESARLKTNYPPIRYTTTWVPVAGEVVGRAKWPMLIRNLIDELSTLLEKNGFGALKVGVAWAIESNLHQFERVAKRPTYQADALWSRIAPSLSDIPDGAEQITVYLDDIRPLTSVQTKLVLHNGMLLTESECSPTAKDEIPKLLSHVNRKFPKGLQVGLQPSFRERRLAAILNG